MVQLVVGEVTDIDLIVFLGVLVKIEQMSRQE